MEQFSQMFGLHGETALEALQQSSGNLQAVMESATVIASGLHEVTGEWMRFAQERVEHNLNHLDRLQHCRNLHDCVALQTQIVRDSLQAFLESGRRTSERSTQIARSATDRYYPGYSSTISNGRSSGRTNSAFSEEHSSKT